MMLILEGPRHINHSLVHDGVLDPMPAPRLAPWPDNRPQIPFPWGLTQTQQDMDRMAIETIKIWRKLPPHRRHLQVTGGLARSIDRTFPGMTPTATTADILRAMMDDDRTLPCDQDIVLLSQFARRVRDAGMEPARVWVDDEVWPPEPQYEDINDLLLRGNGWDYATIQKRSLSLLNATQMVVCRALGWKCEVVTVDAANQHALHRWEADTLPDAAKVKGVSTYTHIDASWTVDRIKSTLHVAAAKGAAGVFVFGEDAEQDQLEALRPMFMDVIDVGLPE